MEDSKRGNPKSRVGVVVSDRMDKTAIVRVDRRVPHKQFKKIITKSKRYYVHDQENNLNVGDRVKIIETRPLSKLKRWRLGEVISRSSESGGSVK